MAGSIRPVKGKTDSFELRVYLGRDSRGRVRHKHETFHGSERAAERRLARLVIEYEDSPGPPPEEPTKWGPTCTINDAIEAWKAIEWADLSPKTTDGYESTWKRHIKESIGRERIATLSTYEVEKYLHQLKKDGAGKHTVRQVRGVLRRACKLARKWSGGTLPNPVTDSELPRWSTIKTKPSVRSPEPKEVTAMFVAGRDEDARIIACLRTAAATGMRREELCALRWSDIDWEGQTVQVDEGTVAVKGGALVKEPKTSASVRVVDLDLDSINHLRELREIQLALANECGVQFDEDGFVFSFSPGCSVPPHPDTITHHFAVIRTRAGMGNDVQPVHSLRRFQATQLDGVISDRQIEFRLGHSAQTMSHHYTGRVPEEGRRAAEHIGKLLGSPPSLTES